MGRGTDRYSGSYTHTQLTELSIVPTAGMLAGANINIQVLPLAPSVCKCESHIYHVSVRLPTVTATPFFHSDVVERSHTQTCTNNHVPSVHNKNKITSRYKLVRCSTSSSSLLTHAQTRIVKTRPDRTKKNTRLQLSCMRTVHTHAC